MSAEQNCSETGKITSPDSEELAWDLAKERRFEEWLSCIRENERELRDYHKYTDRQLRELSAEMRGISHELWREYGFDVASDCYEVDLDGETSISVSRSGARLDEVPGTLTRKDKRRKKTKQRRAASFLRIRRMQWEKSRAASVVRKTGALSPVVAGMCHA